MNRQSHCITFKEPPTARGVGGRLAKLLRWFRPHWNALDRLLVLKGPAWVEERGEARHAGLLRDLALRKLTSYPLPGTESESVLLQICPKERAFEGNRCRITKLPGARKRGTARKGGRARKARRSAR